MNLRIRAKSKQTESAQSEEPVRFVLVYFDGDAPSEHVKAIKAIPGLTIEGNSSSALLVSGPGSLQEMENLMPKVEGWTVAQELSYKMLNASACE